MIDAKLVQGVLGAAAKTLVTVSAPLGPPFIFDIIDITNGGNRYALTIQLQNRKKRSVYIHSMTPNHEEIIGKVRYDRVIDGGKTSIVQFYAPASQDFKLVIKCTMFDLLTNGTSLLEKTVDAGFTCTQVCKFNRKQMNSKLQTFDRHRGNHS